MTRIIDLEIILKSLGCNFLREYQFLKSRKFRFDFVLLPIENKIALEYEGGIFSDGRHVRGGGYAKDCEKYNLAQLEGWLVLRYTSITLEQAPMDIIRAQRLREEKKYGAENGRKIRKKIN